MSNLPKEILEQMQEGKVCMVDCGCTSPQQCCFKKFEKPQSQQLSWVKANERLPERVKDLNLKVNGNPETGYLKPSDDNYFHIYNKEPPFSSVSHHYVYWLDESPPIESERRIKRIVCSTDEQQCRDSCEYKGHKEDCPLATVEYDTPIESERELELRVSSLLNQIKVRDAEIQRLKEDNAKLQSVRIEHWNEVQRLKEALDRIAYPIKHFQQDVEKEGAQLDGRYATHGILNSKTIKLRCGLLIVLFVAAVLMVAAFAIKPFQKEFIKESDLRRLFDQGATG